MQSNKYPDFHDYDDRPANRQQFYNPQPKQRPFPQNPYDPLHRPPMPPERQPGGAYPRGPPRNLQQLQQA